MFSPLTSALLVVGLALGGDFIFRRMLFLELFERSIITLGPNDQDKNLYTVRVALTNETGDSSALRHVLRFFRIRGELVCRTSFNGGDIIIENFTAMGMSKLSYDVTQFELPVRKSHDIGFVYSQALELAQLRAKGRGDLAARPKLDLDGVTFELKVLPNWSIGINGHTPASNFVFSYDADEWRALADEANKLYGVEPETVAA